jgi:hypothetical protein
MDEDRRTLRDEDIVTLRRIPPDDTARRALERAVRHARRPRPRPLELPGPAAPDELPEAAE